MYIAPWQGQTFPRGQSFDVNRNVLSLHLLVVSFKTMFSKSDFILFFKILLVYSPASGADSPRGQNFDVNRKALSLFPFIASFKEITLKFDFIQPPGEKVLISTETSCHFGHLLLVSNHRQQ